jgi:hypothetical protein
MGPFISSGKNEEVLYIWRRLKNVSVDRKKLEKLETMNRKLQVPKF